MNVSLRNKNPVWWEMSKYISVRVDTIKKILCFNSSRFFLNRFLPARWFDKLLIFQTSKGSKFNTFSGASESRPCWILTCPYMPMTLEDGGTISQLRQLRSHAPSKATPSSMSAKLRDNRLSIYSIFFEDVSWVRLQFVLREQSRPRESLNCPADCPVEGKRSLHLSCVTKPWGSLCPSLLMTMGSKIVEDSATALTQTAVFIFFIFSLLDWGTSWASCASHSSNIHAKGIQQVSSLRRTHNNIKWKISQFTSFLYGSKQKEPILVVF